MRVYAQPYPQRKFHRLVQPDENYAPVFACDGTTSYHDLMHVVEIERLDGSRHEFDRMYVCRVVGVEICRKCFRGTYKRPR